MGPAVTNREQRQALDHCELDQNAESGAHGEALRRSVGDVQIGLLCRLAASRIVLALAAIGGRRLLGAWGADTRLWPALLV